MNVFMHEFHDCALRLSVNGQLQDSRVDPETTLLELLRDHLGLTGTKKGCDRGQCGACTVLVDGRRIKACLALAIMQDGRNVVTIEGLGSPCAMHPVQQSFVDHDALQCGYCTPGQVCSAVGLSNELRDNLLRGLYTNPDAPSDDDLREAMSGNLCRCGAYINILAAVRDSLAATSKPAGGEVAHGKA